LIVVIIFITIKGDELNLLNIKKTQKAIVNKINATSELKQRLHSLGIIKGAELEVIDCSMAKSTIKLKVGNTLVAIRQSEAGKIEVKDEK